MFAHGGSAVPLGVYLLRWCGEKENTLAVLYVIFAVGNFLIRGLTRRLRRGVQVQSRGVVNSFWQANRRGAGGERKAPCKRHYKATLPKAVPAGGLTRRLRRGRWGCRTEGGSTFFRSERKYQRKLAARRLREKAFYCPFCRRGSQRRAHQRERVISNVRARSCAHLFPPSKRAGLFPSAAYRRSAPPQAALGRLTWRRLGCSDAAEMVSQRRKTGLFFAVGAIHTPIAPLGILQNGLDIFATKKASVVFYPR